MSDPVAPARPRIDSVDVLRGVIMVVMALDHTRDFFGAAAVSPTDLATTTAGLFLTRWITHFCAPVFFLLSGVGTWLSRGRRGTAGLSRFLITRGIWLILLDTVLFRFLLQFNADYHVTILTVLWAFGWAMIALAALVWLPTRAIAAIAVAMIVGHNLLDGIPPRAFGALAPLWSVVHAGGVLYAAPGRLVIAGYPLIPWMGVMALGYAIGPVYALDAGRRRALLLRTGLALAVAFVALRLVNLYGDPARWTPQRDATFTLLSFLNVTKYPPSLLFLLMTLGPALVALALLDGRRSAALQPVRTIGRVPLFYYLLHFTIIHLLALAALAVRFGAAHDAWESPTPDRYPITQPAGWPASLPVVYLWWAVVVLLAYPACRWYAGFKARRTDPWLSYL